MEQKLKFLPRTKVLIHSLIILNSYLATPPYYTIAFLIFSHYNRNNS